MPTTPRTTALEIIGVSKRFGGRTVLCDVDIELVPGEVVALVGANGAGKSTLLRIVAGAIRADQGTIRIDGHDADRDTAAARSALGWALGDEHAWYWRLSGRQNLEVFGGMRGLSAEEARLQADRLLGELDLHEHAERAVATYSTGMKARLALARARMGAPAAIVFDEATRGLDAASEEAFVNWVRTSQAGILMATHTLTEAAACSDRVVVLHDGRIVSELRSPFGVHDIEAALGVSG